MRGFYGPPVLVGLGGLALLVATAAGWVTQDASRTVGNITVEGLTQASGTQFAAAAIPAGLTALVLGGLLAALSGPGRRVVGVLAAGAGVAGLAAVIAGVTKALDAGTLTAAPWAALAGAVAIAAGGVLATVRGGSRPRRSRYQVPSEQTPDDEWDIASGE